MPTNENCCSLGSRCARTCKKVTGPYNENQKKRKDGIYCLKIERRRRSNGKVDDTYTFASLAVNSRPARQPYLPPPTLNTPCTTHNTQAAAVTRGKQASHSKHPVYSRCPPAPPGIPVCPVRLAVRSSLAVLAPRWSRGGRADPPSRSFRPSPGDRSPRTAAAGASIGATIRRLSASVILLRK